MVGIAPVVMVLVSLAGLAVGTALPAAATGGAPDSATPTVTAAHSTCRLRPDMPKRQVRGEWVATVANTDWPSRPGLSPAEQKAELRSWLDEARARGLNTVVLQVRPTADTFWPSKLEPWSRYLTGVPGADPGYDPLAFAVQAAHRRNLELHAWFNPYRVAMTTDRDALAPNSPARTHPDWVVAYGGRLYYDPGIPAVRRHVERVVLEVVRRYDVDAVHFDDYFYPYPAPGRDFPDAATFATYGGGFTDRADWRRHNIDRLVSELDRRIHRTKPWVKFGVSPFAVWRNVATDPRGSDTTAGVQTYDDLYADTRRWVREQWLDYVAPQVYWTIGFAPADYAVLVPWWVRVDRGTDVQLYVGQASYKVGTSTQDPAWSDPSEMSRHLTLNQRFPRVRGDLFFSAKDVRADRLGHMDLLQAAHYTRPALPPVTRGVPGRAPRPVTALRGVRVADGTRLTWRGQGSSYAVYRFARTRVTGCGLADAAHLLATVHSVQGPVQHFRDTTAPASAGRTYVVTALDRAYRESRPTQVRTAR